MTREAIKQGLSQIFRGIKCLTDTFPKRSFTIDGRLVGDVGEVIASLEYDIILHEIMQPKQDATTSDGRNVQIKATYKEALTFRSVPDFYLGFKLFPNGEHEEIFNGPGNVIYEQFTHRKGIGEMLLSFPVAELRRLSAGVPQHQRIPKRGIG